MDKIILKPLEKFNAENLNSHQVSMRGSVSYPTAVKYLRNEVEEPGIVYVARILAGLGVDWKQITLGDLLEVVSE